MTNDTRFEIIDILIGATPTQMIEQLRSAGTSIDNYLGVCSILHDCLTQGLPHELSVYLEQELALILPYEQKLQQARSVIGHIHNCCTNITPINKLPSEIMARTFGLVWENPRNLPPDSLNSCPKHPGYPDWLAQVCSRWRTIALASPILWSHIDLTPHLASGRGGMDRARAYTERAGNMPYEIHVHDGARTRDVHHRMERMVSFLADHSNALEFTIVCPKLLSFHSHMFQGLVSKCNPKIFKTLRVHSYRSFLKPFIEGYNPVSWEADVDHEDSYTDLVPNVVRLSRLDRSELTLLIKSRPARLVFSKLEILTSDRGNEPAPNETLRAEFPTAEFLNADLGFVRTADWDILDGYVFPR